MTRAFVAASLAALVVGTPARAHVTPVPAFAPAGDTTRVALSGPNERSAPMTGFAVVAPVGLAIVRAHPSGEWEPEIDGPRALWSGGQLVGGAEATFELDLEVDEETTPGVVELVVEQRYADGNLVRWPVMLTVTPGTEAPSQHFALAAVVALGGAFVVAALAALVLRRRTRPLSES